MNNFFVFIARTIVCFEKEYYPKTNKNIKIALVIIFFIIVALAAPDNHTLNRISSIAIFSAIALYIFIMWVKFKYYESFVIINKKYFTPNTIREGKDLYDVISLGIFGRLRILYNSCEDCTRKEFCTSQAENVRQCDLYYDSSQMNMDSDINMAILTQHVVKDPMEYKPTFSSFIDLRDGNPYKTINIGVQTWMAENLRYIPYISHEDVNEGIWVHGYSGNDVKRAVLTNYYLTYGCLYSRETARYACPEGYHLPSIDEWMTLINYFGGVNMAGNKLKAQKEWIQKTPQVTNESGFSALPGGYCNYSGVCI